MKKIVVITGITRGIGKAIAQKFYKNGYEVLGTFINSQKDSEKLISKGIKCYKVDVSNYLEMSSFVDEIINKYGKIDVFINNAGVSLSQKFIADVNENEFDYAVKVNLKGVFNGTKLAVQNMLFNGGVIINVSSIFGLVGGSCEAVYSMTKSGVIGLTRSVSEELLNSKLSICAICPGLVDTDMNSHLSDEEKLNFINDYGLKNICKPSFVANRVFKIVNSENVNGKIYKICAYKKLKK